MADIVKYKFRRNEVDVLPVFNEGFEYSYTDINENSLIVRTITSESNPSSISFKDKNIVKIESLNLTNVEELDIDNLELNVITNITTLIAACNTLKVLRAKANVINDLIPHLQTKTNSNSGTIIAADVAEFVNNESLNIKHWYVDEYRYVDLFVMMGQSNMEGQSEKPEAFEVPTYQSYTYMYNSDTLGQVKHPYGEWINNQVTDEALKQQWLADPTMSGVWWQMEGAEGGQQGQPYAALQPYFAAEYYNQTKVPTLMVQCACGATTVGEWLPGHAKGRYELAVEKITRAVAKAEAEIDRPIRNKYLVWLQGESDGIYKTGTDNYKTRFMQLWTALKTDCGLEKCFMIRVAKFREGKYNDKPIIEAQEQLSQENDDIIIATRITGLLEYPTVNPENPTIQDGVTEGYPYVDHYTVAGYKLVGETTAAKIAEYLKIGLRPELEPEPYEGEITSSAEALLVSYKFNNSIKANLLPTFGASENFEYRVFDTVDGNVTSRKIITSFLPTEINFTSETSLLEVNYINMRNINMLQKAYLNCSNLTYLNMPYISKVESMELAFRACKKLQLIDGMEKWDTSRNNNWGSTFRECTSLTKLPVENFILSNVHAMGSTFQGSKISSLEGFNTKNWRTPYIQYLSSTFAGLNITELDLSMLDTRILGAASQMFNGCSQLEKLNISNWILTNEHYNWQGTELNLNPLQLTYLFRNCNKLNEVIMKNSNRFSIYKIAEKLPTRSADSPGTFIISMDEELDNELSNLVTSKGWNINYKKQVHEYEIASYYFDPRIGNLLPVFNEGFEYTYNDSGAGVNGILRTIKSTQLPTEIHFGTTHVSQEDASSLLKLLSLDTTNVKDYSGMFKNCNNLAYLGSGIISKAATKLASMFEGCTAFDYIYLNMSYTENVIDMTNMFKNSSINYLTCEDFILNENVNLRGMFEGCTNFRNIRVSPDTLKKLAKELPVRPFTEPGGIRLRTGVIDDTQSLYDQLDTVCDKELLERNWLTDRNRHLDLFLMMGQSNMQGQSYIYKEFEVPWYQSCTYLYNSDEIAQVKHPFGEHINTQGSVEELGYYQLEGAVGCETGLPYGSLSPHFAASYFEQTKVPTLMVPCCCGASTVKQWWPGTTQQRFELSVEKTQKSIAAVEEIGRTIRHKNLVWLQGESDGYGAGVGNKTKNYKNNFLTFWRAIKEALGLEKCLIIRVAKFREGLKYNTLPIMEAQEQLALENDDIELVTRITGYLEYPAQNPENPTLQHHEQGYPASNHDHYTWEGYRLVGETAGTRVGTYIRTGIMPELEPEPFEDGVASSSKYHVATYKFDNTVYADYVPEFNEGYQYSVIDTVEGNITTRRILGVGLPTLMRFGAYYTYEEIETVQRTATERELCLKEIVFADTSAVTDATNMFCLNENLTSIPALVIRHCPSLYCMFYKCSNLTYIDGRNFDMSKVTNVENFTWMCTKLQTVDATGWDMSNVNNMYTMFINANALVEIKGIEDWDVSNVKTLISVFYTCKALTSLDLSKWNVENATTIWWMFNGCISLTTLNLSNWHLTNCIDFTEPFKNCKALNTITMTNSDYITVNNIIAQLPTKTAAAPGTLIINNVDAYEQVDLETATAKYWNVEHRREMLDFNKKIVNGEILNNFAKKFNKKIQNKIDNVNNKPVEKYDDTELRQMIENKADKSELFSKDYNDLTNKPFYDTREYEDVVIEYDGNTEGRTMCSIPAIGLSTAYKVADLTAEQLEQYKASCADGFTLTYLKGDGSTEVVQSSVVQSFMGDPVSLYAGGIGQVFLSAETFSTEIGHANNYVNEAGVYFKENTGTNPYKVIKLEFQNTTGEVKTIEPQFLTNSPGIKVEEGKSYISQYNSQTYVTQNNAEIFNDTRNIATGQCSHAEGAKTEAHGSYSHAEGYSTYAIGSYSHAEGGFAKAIGEYSHAEGDRTLAEGSDSHVEGYSNKAIGYCSHAEGSDNKAIGEVSHAEGYKTTASGKWQHVQGVYNIEDTENKYAHIVGNGDYMYGGSGPSNAHTLDWDGNAWFAGDVFIKGTSQDDGQKLATEEFVNNAVSNMLSGLRLVQMTQSEYDALEVKDSNTLYIII